MKTSSIVEKKKKSLVRKKVTFFIIASILATLLFLAVIYYNSSLNMRIVLFSLIGIFFYVFMTSVLGFLKYISITKLISLNQFHEFDENKITVYDVLDYTGIENEFAWNDIYYIEEVNFNSGFDAILGYKNSGLVLIADKEKFYKGINPKNKELDKTQKRQMKLSGGFFIQCTREDIDTIQGYWGKEIKKTI